MLVATDALGPTNSKDDDGLESPEAILRSQMSTSELALDLRESPSLSCMDCLLGESL